MNYGFIITDQGKRARGNEEHQEIFYKYWG